MLRLGRLKRILVRYSEELQPFIKPVKLLGMISFGAFIAHVLACLWYLVGDVSDTLADGSELKGWIHAFHDDEGFDGVLDGKGRWGVRISCAPLACQLPECDPRTCVVEKPRVADAYMVAFYWSVTTLTTIGYGDISPITVAERWLGIFAMAVGSFFFGMLVGSLSAHITSGNIADQEHRTKMETVREFMRTHEVPHDVRRRVTAYMDNFYSNKTAFNEEEVLGRAPRGKDPGSRVLPAAMDRQLKEAMYANITKCIPFLHGLEPDIVASLAERMRPISFAHGERVTTEGEVGLDMFIIMSGQVTVMKNGGIVTDEHGEPLLLGSGAVFGEETLLHVGAGPNGDRRPETHVAAGALECRTIPSIDMFKLMSDHPDLARNLVNYVVQREKEKRTKMAPDTPTNKQLVSTSSISLSQLEKLAQMPIKKVKKARRTSVANVLQESVEGGADVELDDDALEAQEEGEDGAALGGGAAPDLQAHLAALAPPPSPSARDSLARLHRTTSQGHAQLEAAVREQAGQLQRLERKLDALVSSLAKP